MSGNICITNIDFALLSSRLVNVASSLQGVAQDVQTIGKTPQAASAEAPPWALLLIDNTQKILSENRKLRKENQGLKDAVMQSIPHANEIPPWARRLSDKCQKVVEEQARQSQTIDHGNAHVVKCLDEVLKTLREAKLESIIRMDEQKRPDVQETPLLNLPSSVPSLNASKAQPTLGELGSLRGGIQAVLANREARRLDKAKEKAQTEAVEADKRRARLERQEDEARLRAEHEAQKEKEMELKEKERKAQKEAVEADNRRARQRQEEETRLRAEHEAAEDEKERKVHGQLELKAKDMELKENVRQAKEKAREAEIQRVEQAVKLREGAEARRLARNATFQAAPLSQEGTWQNSRIAPVSTESAVGDPDFPTLRRSVSTPNLGGWMAWRIQQGL